MLEPYIIIHFQANIKSYKMLKMINSLVNMIAVVNEITQFGLFFRNENIFHYFEA